MLSAFSLTAFAQDDIKRVAILETVDRGGDVNLGVKNLLRQSITFGINRIPGYEGYNRVDMAQITGEHDFQRTGYVSDADIKKLGVMTGAAYVLIAEATTYDATHILVFANLVDVESGRITNSSVPKVAGIAPNEMYEDCAEVAKSLLGVSKETKAQTNVSNSKTVPAGYVNLGLPSGTLWKAENEDCGLITYEQAYNFYGNSMPTKEQLQELKDNCLWTWQGNGYKVKGKNGESIFLPAAGYRSCDGEVNRVGSCGNYWSSTPDGSESAWDLYFGSSEVAMDGSNRCYGRSVRLVR